MRKKIPNIFTLILTFFSYLKKLLNNSIRIQDADRVFESVAKNEIGTSIAFDFLRKNWNELLNRYVDNMFYSINENQ